MAKTTKHLYDEEDLETMSSEQVKAIKMIEALGKKMLGDDFGTFADYMKQNVVTINVSRRKTEITFEDVEESELLDILLPNIMKRILGFYDKDDRTKIMLRVLRECKDGKEELCVEKD